MNRKQGLARQSPKRLAPRASRASAAKEPRVAQPSGAPEYVLRLFVSGLAPRSQRAIDNLHSICERYLAGRHCIEVIDLRTSPGSANDEQIVATPTLLKIQPLPPRRLIGDLSQVDKVLHGLDIA